MSSKGPQPGSRKGPLAGIRVIDLTSVVFGPYATQIMADMGADVIKVEPPAGDNTRHITVGPAPGMGGIYVNVNRGKRGVMLDLREDEDKETLRKLVATADVFIHSMRGSAIRKLGFGYESVRAIRPDIIYANCYGYSRRGPEGESAIAEFGECPPIKDLTVLLGSSNGRKFNRIGLVADPYVAGPYAEGNYDITVPVTAEVLEAVRPAYKDAFALR